MAYAAEGGKLEVLSKELLEGKKEVYTLDLPENEQLMEQGAVGQSVEDLVEVLR